MSRKNDGTISQLVKMKLSQKGILCLLLTIGGLLPISLIGQAIPTYQEDSGLVVIDIESATNYGLWKLDTTKVGFIGDSYLLYTGANYFNNPGNSLLTFEVKIEKTGRYRFQWHSLIAIGDSNTEHNDSWLRFKDADDFYGDKNGVRVYPRGVGKTPNPEGSSKDGWLKIYQNNREGWTWKTRTNDNDPHEIFVEFDTAGTYTLEVSGRSNGHAIDRIVLYHSEVNSATALNLNLAESERVRTVSVREIPFKDLTIRPTLAQNVIYFDLPASSNYDIFDGQIFNSFGQQVQSFSFRNNGGDAITLPIKELGKGNYFVQFRRGTVYYRGKFLKL